jgi:hypothetical protein
MTKQASPHRQLSEEEARLYAAGMAARKRGELAPSKQLSPEHYNLWRMGWNRAGRSIHGGPIFRSRSHHTAVEGVHVLRTQVETLSQAVDVIAIRQRAAKQSVTQKERAKSVPQHAKLKLAVKGSEMLRRQHEKKRADLVVHREAVAEIEQRLVERIARCIEMLRFSVEEMSAVSAMRSSYPAISQTALIGMIERLCNMIGVQMPSFAVSRQPGQQSHTRRCINCGAVLSASEIDYCLHCTPRDDSVRIASELQREHHRQLKGLESEAKELGRLINKTEKALKYGSHQGHGRHPNTDAADLEAGGRTEDLDGGGAASHQPGTDDPGDSQG